MLTKEELEGLALVDNLVREENPPEGVTLPAWGTSVGFLRTEDGWTHEVTFGSGLFAAGLYENVVAKVMGVEVFSLQASEERWIALCLYQDEATQTGYRVKIENGGSPGFGKIYLEKLIEGSPEVIFTGTIIELEKHVLHLAIEEGQVSIYLDYEPLTTVEEAPVIAQGHPTFEGRGYPNGFSDLHAGGAGPHALKDAILATPSLLGVWPLGVKDLEYEPGEFAYSDLNHPGEFPAKGHGTLTDGEPSLLPTGEGKATEFDGGSSYVQIPDEPGYRVGNSFAIEIWIELDVITGFQTLFAGADSSFQVYVDFNGRVCLDKKEISNIARSSTMLVTNTLYQIVATKDSSGGKIYVNGVDVTEELGNDEVEEKEHDWVIGKAADSELAYLDGEAQFVALYNAPLTFEEVEAHYKAGIEGEPEEPEEPEEEFSKALICDGGVLVKADRYVLVGGSLVQL